MTPAAVEIKNLTKRYPQVKRYRELFLHPFRKNTITALDGIDLTVESGECFCLLGPNGAGKTTLVKILSTLVLPDEGQALVAGFDVRRDVERIKNIIGYAIPDERSFYWRLTGRQNLKFFAALNNLAESQAERKIREVLELTNLVHAADQMFATYSTGMRQMLAFARALLQDARILFVDEPTRSLDPQAAAKVRSFLREDLVEGHGRTVFWTTHNLTEAEEFADRLAIIAGGRIKAVGSVGALMKDGTIPLSRVYEEAVGGSD